MLYTHKDINHNSNTIHIQTQVKTGRLCHFRYEQFINPWRHEERDTILKSFCKLYYADPAPMHSASCDVLDFNSSLLVKIRKTGLHLSTVKIQLYASTVQSQLTSFQNPQILRTISSRHDIIHPISWLGVYYDKWWLSYPLRTSVTAPNDNALGLKRLE